MILSLEDIAADHLSLVGGKGAQLGACARAGLPVPPGFCITSEAYLAVTAPIAAELTAAAAAGDAARARELVLAQAMPAELERSIAEAYARIGSPPVAVRSSATAEDLADASFAGQQETLLGITGAQRVADAVRRCWASLWSDRAVSYRAHRDVPAQGLAIAVIVQRMVRAQCSGVLFTRDPLAAPGGPDAAGEPGTAGQQGAANEPSAARKPGTTGEPGTAREPGAANEPSTAGQPSTAGAMLVNASYGLGESIVSGLVTPDTFRIGRDAQRVLSRQIGGKETRIDLDDAGGTRERPVPAPDRERPCLDDAQLLRLARLGLREEARAGEARDIEWAIADGELFLLQSRPITVAASAREAGHDPVRGWFARLLREDLIEHFPAPYPLDLIAVHGTMHSALTMLRSAGLTLTLPAERIVTGDDDGIVRVRAATPRVTPRAFTRMPRLLAGSLRASRGWPACRVRWEARAMRLRARGAALAGVPDAGVLGLVEDALTHVAELTEERYRRYLVPLMLHHALAEALMLASRVRPRPEVTELFEELPYTSALVNEEIARLAAAAERLGLSRALAEAPAGGAAAAIEGLAGAAAFQRALDDFLDCFGARAARMYVPFSTRSWREEPEALLALVAAAGQAGFPPVKKRRAMVAVERGLPPPLRRAWRRNTARLRAMHLAREGTVYLIEELFCAARAAMDALAARLVDRGALEHAEDIRFLYFAEVREALDAPGGEWRARVACRRRRRPAAEAVWWERDDVPAEGAITGLPSSAGRAAGPARIILTPADFPRLRPGDVLVCPATDPAWTPLFSLASAVVADRGGPISHAAIVAREYGIPAVLGTRNASSVIRDGALLIVNGDTGQVIVKGDASGPVARDLP